MNQLKQQAICVLGMHRSGTSAIARALNLLGAYIGPSEKLLPPQEDNPEGFWEHETIVDFHLRILRTLNRSWYSVTPLPDRWWQRPEIEPYRQELADLIRREFGGQRLWMWKDPRTALVLPLWIEVLQQLEIEPYYVICLRHPLDVAASLHRRDGFSIERSLVLWQFYNLSSFYWTNDARRWVISYDRLLEDWEPCLTNLISTFDFVWPSSVAEQRVALGQFLQLQLRHSQSDLAALAASGDAGELVARAYRIFLEGERTPALLQSADFIRQIDREYHDYCRYPRVFAHLADVDVQAYTERPAVEVFWLVNGEFSQNVSFSTDVFVDGQEHSYECPLPSLSGRVLRLDPVNFPAAVEIRSIELSVREPSLPVGTIMYSWGPENNFRDIVAGPDITLLSAHSQGLLCVFSSSDPQLLLYNVPDMNHREDHVTTVLRVTMSVKNVIPQHLAETLVHWRDEQQQAAAANMQTALEAKDVHIHNLDATITHLHEALEAKDVHIHNLDATITHLQTINMQQEQTVQLQVSRLQSQESRLQSQESRLQSLDALLQDRTATLTEALATVADREAALQQAQAQVQELEQTLERRMKPFRYLRRLLRWPRLHRVRLLPDHDALRESDESQSAGEDSYFLLQSEHGQLPSGWVILSYQTRTLLRWLHPTLYIDHGTGFLESQRLELRRPLKIHTAPTISPVPESAGISGHRGEASEEPLLEVQFLMFLTVPVRALRLKFVASPTQLVLKNVTLRGIGILQAATLLGWRHLRPALVNPRYAVPMIRQGWDILTNEGLGTFRRRFLLQQARRSSYHDWVVFYDTLTDEDRRAIGKHLERLPLKPLISVIMPTYNTPELWLRRTIESVRKQLYPHWELCIADDASTTPHVRQILQEYQAKDTRIKVMYREQNGHVAAASNSAITLATGEFLALLDHDDELAEHALYAVAVEINAHPDAAIIYTDEDKISEHGERYQPYFKPDWNPDLLLTQNFVSHLGVYRADLVRDVGNFREGYEGSQDWDLLLRISERIPASRIRHIPQVLYHWRAISGSTALGRDQKTYATDAQHKLLTSHLERINVAAQVLPGPGDYWRVRYTLPQPPPLVTLIVPTRNRFDLLHRCVESIFAKTTYPRFELMIVDNQSDDPQTLDYLRQLTHERAARVLQYDAPFNYSAINNLAVQQAQGDVICLLNNDIEVITPDWLEEMVSQALRPEVGVVGAMLYYPNDTIQHAGVVVGLLGIAGHAYAVQPRGHGGQMLRAQLQQNLSAVTAACAVFRRSVFLEVGGLDERNLSVAFNDVDLCLRLVEKGYRNVWTPYAELYHHESASRGFDDNFEKQARFKREIAYMSKRWRHIIRNDPAHNPNLTLERGDASLAFPPRSRRPWL